MGNEIYDKGLLDGALMTEKQAAQLMVPATQIPTVFTGTSTTFLSDSQPNSDTMGREQVEKTAQHSKGYYYKIRVNSDDTVNYQIYEGGRLARLIYAVTHATTGPPIWQASGAPSSEWSSVRKRTHLPATLGECYEKIDEEIAQLKEAKEHTEYAKGLLDTDPENLKMIGDLEALQEGEGDDGVDHQAPTITNVSAGTISIPGPLGMGRSQVTGP